jgi:hypothetical protein
MPTKKVWKNVVLPYDSFKLGTGRGAMVFEIQEGDFKGWGFVRPLVLVRKSFEKGRPGFSMAYSIEQELSANGDVVSEKAETIKLTLNEKGADGKYHQVDEMEIPADTLEAMLQ